MIITNRTMSYYVNDIKKFMIITNRTMSYYVNDILYDIFWER